MRGRKRTSKRKTAEATIHFTSAKNSAGRRQRCVYAECQLSGGQVGPIWGHADESVRKALAELTARCDCPARFHRAQEFTGARVAKSSRR